VLALGLALLVPETEAKAAPVESSLAVRAVESRDGLRDVMTTPAVFTAAGGEATIYLGFGPFFLGFSPPHARTAGLDDAEIAVVLAFQLAIALRQSRLWAICPIGSGASRQSCSGRWRPWPPWHTPTAALKFPSTVRQELVQAWDQTDLQNSPGPLADADSFTANL
jgi:hypothetical protein